MLIRAKPLLKITVKFKGVLTMQGSTKKRRCSVRVSQSRYGLQSTNLKLVLKNIVNKLSRHIGTHITSHHTRKHVKRFKNYSVHISNKFWPFSGLINIFAFKKNICYYLHFDTPTFIKRRFQTFAFDAMTTTRCLQRCNN